MVTVTRESPGPAGMAIIMLTIIVSAVTLAGCAGAPFDGSVNQSRDAYLQAYGTGIEWHAAGQDYFNNGTLAWENSDYRTAIADYANASLNYGEAAKYYGTMARYARGSQESEFAESLRGCAFNISRASDNYMNAAIALSRNDSNTAYDWFNRGRALVNASEALLNRSAATTPDWLIALASD
jgi:hypothetical protein